MRRRWLIVLLFSGVLLWPGAAQAIDEWTPAPELGASTQIGNAYLGGHAWAVAGAAAGSGSDLLVQCYRAFASNANADEFDTRIAAGIDPEVAAEGLPWPDVGHTRVTVPTSCSGNAVRVTGDGMSCPEGEVPGELIAYSYELETSSDFYGGTGTFVYESLTEARIGGGDSGVFDIDRCVEVTMTGSDSDGFSAWFSEPTFQKSPAVRGLTGLDTWVWYDFTNPTSHSVLRTTSASLGPLAITLESELWVDKVEWDIDGDGTFDVTLDAPDSFTEPAPRDTYVSIGGSAESGATDETFTFESIGTYNPTTQVTWRGVYRVTQITDGVLTVGYTGTPNLYGPLLLTHIEPYEVIAVRSELRNNDG